jgi:2-keto-3-deoxy-L-rhamnonate aldolase RhmA
MMRPNRLRALFKENRPATGIMIQEIHTPAIAIILAQAGFDFAFVDMEHGRFDHESASNLIQSLRQSGLTPLVRVPDGEYYLIARALDAGAEGIMLPRVENREQVECFVASMRFPPEGKRGLSATKGHNDFQPADAVEFTRFMNRENLAILQIERREAVDNIDSLLDVPGVDGIVIGPNDLSLSLGATKSVDDPQMEAAIARVFAAAHQRGIFTGIHAGLDWNAHWRPRGMNLLACSTDLEMLNTACKKLNQDLKRIASE